MDERKESISAIHSTAVSTTITEDNNKENKPRISRQTSIKSGDNTTKVKEDKNNLPNISSDTEDNDTQLKKRTRSGISSSSSSSSVLSNGSNSSGTASPARKLNRLSSFFNSWRSTSKSTQSSSSSYDGSPMSASPSTTPSSPEHNKGSTIPGASSTSKQKTSKRMSMSFSFLKKKNSSGTASSYPSSSSNIHNETATTSNISNSKSTPNLPSTTQNTIITKPSSQTKQNDDPQTPTKTSKEEDSSSPSSLSTSASAPSSTSSKHKNGNLEHSKSKTKSGLKSSSSKKSTGEKDGGKMEKSPSKKEPKKKKDKTPVKKSESTTTKSNSDTNAKPTKSGSKDQVVPTKSESPDDIAVEILPPKKGSKHNSANSTINKSADNYPTRKPLNTALSSRALPKFTPSLNSSKSSYESLEPRRSISKDRTSATSGTISRRANLNSIIANNGIHHSNTNATDAQNSVNPLENLKKRLNRTISSLSGSPKLNRRLEETLQPQHMEEIKNVQREASRSSFDSRMDQDDGSDFEDETNDAIGTEFPKVRAIYDFPGEKVDDLTIWEGDILAILATFEDGWWLAIRTDNLNVGRIPSNYVQLLKPGTFVVRALSDFEGHGKEDLRFSEGDIIVISHREDNWWYGELEGEEGWLPSNFVMNVDDTIRSYYMPEADETDELDSRFEKFRTIAVET